MKRMLYDFPIADVESLVMADGRLSLAVRDPEKPTEPPPRPGTMKRIVSDDGNSHAFLIDAGGTYELTEDIEADATAIFVSAVKADSNGSRRVVIRHNGKKIRFGAGGWPGCAGINPIKRLDRDGVWYGDDSRRFSKALADLSYDERDLTVVDGTIEHAGEGSFCCALGGDYTFPMIVGNMKLHAKGADSATIYGSSLWIHDSECVNESRSTRDRKESPANIRVAGKCIASRVRAIGGNSGFYVGSGSRLSQLFVRNHAFATNGYAVNLFEREDVIVEDCDLIPSNGRGVMIGGSPDGVLNPAEIIIRRNRVFGLDLPNAEYGEDLEACGIRCRQNAKNVLCDDNDILVIGGAEWCAGVGIYLTNRPGDPSNRFTNNRIRAALIGEPDFNSNDMAAALGLIGEGQMEDTKQRKAFKALDTIQGNHLESNHLMFCVSHGDGGCDIDRVHCASAKFRPGNEIIRDFRKLIRGDLPKELVDQFDWLERSPGPKPSAKYWVYQGHWLGSRANIVIDDANYLDAAPVLRRSGFPLEVTINGVAIGKPESLP